MKKVFFITAFAAICGIANAQDTDRPIKIETIVYHGSRASNNPDNPCAGALTGICGSKTIQTFANGAKNEEVTDMAGNVFKRDPATGDWIRETLTDDKDGDDDNPLHVSDGDWEIVWGNGNK